MTSWYRVLSVLKDLIEDDDGLPLKHNYGIDVHDADDAPLDHAIAEWYAEGCPMPPERVEEK